MSDYDPFSFFRAEATKRRGPSRARAAQAARGPRDRRIEQLERQWDEVIERPPDPLSPVLDPFGALHTALANPGPGMRAVYESIAHPGSLFGDRRAARKEKRWMDALPNPGFDPSYGGALEKTREKYVRKYGPKGSPSHYEAAAADAAYGSMEGYGEGGEVFDVPRTYRGQTVFPPSGYGGNSIKKRRELAEQQERYDAAAPYWGHRSSAPTRASRAQDIRAGNVEPSFVDKFMGELRGMLGGRGRTRPHKTAEELQNEYLNREYSAVGGAKGARDAASYRKKRKHADEAGMSVKEWELMNRLHSRGLPYTALDWKRKRAKDLSAVEERKRREAHKEWMRQSDRDHAAEMAEYKRKSRAHKLDQQGWVYQQQVREMARQRKIAEFKARNAGQVSGYW